MKLTKLHIHGYRDVAPGTGLVFSPGLNLVLGENGTGRTTLLDLLSRVLAADFSGLIREEFSLEYSLDFPGMDLHITVRNTRATGAARPPSREDSALLLPRPLEAAAELEPFMELVLELDAPGPRLVMRADATGVSWEVDGQPAYSQNMYWSLLDRTVWVVLFMTAQRLEPEVREPLKELLRRTFLLAPARFDEALGTYQQMGTTQYGMEMRGDEVFPLGLMWLPAWMPGLLRERVAREMPPPGGFLDIRHDEVERSFLARFVALNGFTSGLFRVELLDKRSYEGGGRLEFGRFGFRFTRRDGAVLTHEHLGHGQKRLLSFLYYLDVNGDFVIADELANSLHPRHVEACVRELGRRQSFLTSQNPLLFEHVPLGSASEVRASLIHCGTELREGREWKVYANPSPEAATRLFDAYQRGDTPLATLLRTHGVW
ncbi:ATP-binding protein [Archangium gephyra]|uniref:AAA family ATPase n=1 Tax=Archangium gephyra TaxID=48 RepID=UPI0035D4428E